MKLRELKRIIEMELQDRPDYYDPEVTVVVKGGGVGGTPSVRVTHASAGFDWDYHQFMIDTETKLSK